jgi:hypothetical protein
VHQSTSCLTTWNEVNSSHSWEINRPSTVKKLPALLEPQLCMLCLNEPSIVSYSYNNSFNIISLCMVTSPKRNLSSTLPVEKLAHNSLFRRTSMYACTATIGMWRIYLNENLLEAHPSGCNGLVELLLRKQIYRGQSERLQIWIQTNPAASDNFRQHSVWQVTFITCTDITGQHGERKLHGCCHVHCI